MNKPFILNFADYFNPEEPVNKHVEYSSVLNLNILKGTEIPATCALGLEGETFTKAHQDVTDFSSPLRVNLLKMLEGRTLTLVSREETDFSIKKSFSLLIQLLQGETNTRSFQETTDVK